MKVFIVVMSEGCNLNCSYCGVNKQSTDTIDPDLYIEEVWKLRAAHPTEKIRVDFFGGEPLMQMPIIRKIVAAIEHDENIQLFIPTNGLLLTNDIVDYIIEHNIEVSLSYDGLWQDKNRLQLTGKSTSARLIDKKDIIRRIPNLRIHTMVTRGCYNLLENHLFIKEMFGVDPELTLVRDVGTWMTSSVGLLKRGITEMFDWYVDNPTHMPMFFRFYLRHFLNYHSKREVKHNCGAGTNLFTFAENRVIPCNRFKNEQQMLDDIPKYAQMIECSTCEVRHYCEKGCLFEQIKNQGPIVELCSIYKFLYNEVSRISALLQGNPHFNRVVLEEISNAN